MTPTDEPTRNIWQLIGQNDEINRARIAPWSLTLDIVSCQTFRVDSCARLTALASLGIRTSSNFFKQSTSHSDSEKLSL